MGVWGGVKKIGVKNKKNEKKGKKKDKNPQQTNIAMIFYCLQTLISLSHSPLMCFYC